MTRLIWSPDAPSFGVDSAVIYPIDGEPFVWNGIVDLTEKTEDEDVNSVYLDGVKHNAVGSGVFACDVTAVLSPNNLADGSKFDFSYRVKYADGYILHLVYNAFLFKSDILYSSELDPQSFELYTVPIFEPNTNGVGSFSHIIIDSRKIQESASVIISDILYGTDSTSPRMISLAELLSIFDAYASLIITNNGDGTWTATGPGAMIEMTDANTFKIASPSAHYISNTTYTIGPW